MRKKLNCILLVDDDHEDCYFHQLVINKMDITNSIQVAINGLEALKFLMDDHQPTPELIFLDINMPRMNGWEFLEQYQHLNLKQRAKIVILMLTTSINPADLKKAAEIEAVTGYKTKPLSTEMLTEILENHFADYI